MKTNIKHPIWRQRSTAVERCIALVLSFAFIAVNDYMKGLVFDLLPHYMTEAATHKKNFITCSENFTQSNFCLSPECIHTASEVLSKMKTEIEPCDDFYQFACGTYIDETLLSDDKLEVHALSMLTDKVQEQIKDIIEEERPEEDPQFLKLPNALYKACMNKTSIETFGSKPLRRLVKALGGWPVLVGDSWDLYNSWTWQDTIRKQRRLGFPIDFMFGFSIGGNLKNNTEHIINLDQSVIGLNREYMVKGFNETLVSAYFDYMVNVAVHLGANKKTAVNELKESLEFEIELAKITLPVEKRRNPNDLYNMRTLKQLQNDYSYVQWVDYCNSLLPKGLKVDEHEIVNVLVPSFFEDFGKLLNRTSKRTIANYMMWRIHKFSMFLLSDEFRNIQFKYATALYGMSQKSARWKECVYIASGRHTNLGILVGSLFVQKHFNRDSKATALEMVNNIRSVFAQMLDKVQWMDNQTKLQAKKKLQAMTTRIGYTDELLDNDKLKEFYPILNIDFRGFFESTLKIKVYDTDYSFKKLHQPVNKIDWDRQVPPTVVNAYYSVLENNLVFTAGILQGQFFNIHSPMYMNYGAIGTIIGHEITHGFDDRGRHFDYEGNLVNWWQPDAQKAYLKNVECFIEQYGNYTDEQTGLNLNGVKTQNENIADNGGMKQSYEAYKQWVKQNGEEQKLPGLNYTPQQMFWISAAQMWCAKFRTEHLKMTITTSAYMLAKFRILGPLNNINDFSRDFQCAKGTPMNPVKKCKVW